MADDKDVNVDAIAHATLTLVYSVLRMLVKRGIMTDADVKDLFLDAAQRQQSLYDEHGVLSPANEAAAKILEDVAAKMGGQQK